MSSSEARVDAEQARQALATVRRVERQTRRAISRRGGGEILMVWGVVWVVGFLGDHFLADPRAGMLWAAVDLLGVAATLTIVARLGRRVRDPLGPRIGVFWLLLLVYTGTVVWLARPLEPAQLGLLISLLAMLGYVTMGVFLDVVFLWVGLSVSILAVVGYLTIPGYFDLWMGLLGGGTLFGSGLYVARRWR